jgi:hypothetical protein
MRSDWSGLRGFEPYRLIVRAGSTWLAKPQSPRKPTRVRLNDLDAPTVILTA